MTDYRATKASLGSHPVPQWFDDAKLGIFIHWGLFAIPAFAPRQNNVADAFNNNYALSAVMTPYTEWYDNAIRVSESPSAAYHAEHYGDRPYTDFKTDFETGLEHWDVEEWAKLFKRSGAGYVVLVTKHHDGFCLWPSQVTNPHRANWHTQRDVVGELAEAVRAQGLRFGIYYSGGIDWSFNSTPVRTLIQFIGSMPGGEYPAYAEAHIRELIERYQPSILWNDISWPTSLKPMLQMMADYYEAVPEGVVNDRWMHRNFVMRMLTLKPVQWLLDKWLERRIRKKTEAGDTDKGLIPPMPAHFDFRTPEYTTFDTIQPQKWEATRGMSASFGFNRGDTEEHYEDKGELVRSFIDTVSKNGNLLLNVGPRGEDGSIPDPQRQRLESLGDWLQKNGEAIYATQPWQQAQGITQCGVPIRFTWAQVAGDSSSDQRRGSGSRNVYAILLGSTNGTNISIELPRTLKCASHVRRLSDDTIFAGTVRETSTGQLLSFNLDAPLSSSPAYAFVIGSQE
ncbi:MAG: alpha-L-fucosidase [Gammaproteobacteria bacterium]|nr:alpha-L-fucosidase [Gammaproteobacteria bacterium]